MRKIRIMVILIISLAVVIVIGAFARKLISPRHYIHDVVLAEDIVIDSNWKDVGSRELLPIEKDNYGVALSLQPGYEVDPVRGIKSPGEGPIVVPEVLLVGQDGREYKLSFGGARRYRDEIFANFKFDGTLPKTGFSGVRLRSEKPLPLKRVVWSGYNTRDLP